MDIYEKLAELRSAATPTPWKGDSYGIYIWGPNMEMVADGDDEEAYLLRMRGVGANLPIEANRDFLLAIVNSLPELQRRDAEQRRKLEAAERFADRVVKFAVHSGDYDFAYQANSSWERQRDAALTAYRNEIK